MKLWKTAKEFLICTLGAFLFVFAIHDVIAPLGLYNGGFVGMGQIASYTLDHFLHIRPQRVDLAGAVYFGLNVPLFLLAWRSMSRMFLIKTAYTVLVQTALLSFLPVRQQTFTQDMLTACIVGGILAGVGVGIILRAGSSGGGQDILGIYFSKCAPGFSVGKITILVNGFVYGCCALLFDLEVVVYSLIYTVVMSLVIDRVHSQNINTTVLILTRQPGLEKIIIEKIHRGITTWQALGGYTGRSVYVSLVVLSQYEFPALRQALEDFDRNAFIIASQGVQVLGNFEKRFDA